VPIIIINITSRLQCGAITSWTKATKLSLASGSCSRPPDYSQTSINVTPQALHLKIDDNNLLHLPEGVWQLASADRQLDPSSVQLSSVPKCLGQTTKLTRS